MTLSPNALRLLGRLHRHKKAIGRERLQYDCSEQFAPQEPAEVADELVVAGYFDCRLHKGKRVWHRTDKPYTEKMRMKLAAYAQRFHEMRTTLTPGQQVNQTRAPVDPFEAKLFPQHPVHLTGRIHLMEGGND